MHAVGRSTGRSIARLGGLAVGLLAALGAPAIVGAQDLGTVYQSPLPLAVYLGGAATTVALSFVFVLAGTRGRPRRRRVASSTSRPRSGPSCGSSARRPGLDRRPGHRRRDPRRHPSRALFLVGLRVGRRGDPSALLAPVWEWVDPFGDRPHHLLALAFANLGIRGWGIPTQLPAVGAGRGRRWSG